MYNMGPDDLISVGPFQGTGVDMRSTGIFAAFRWVIDNAIPLCLVLLGVLGFGVWFELGVEQS